MSKVIRCAGCGAILQTEDTAKPGYVTSLDHEYCQSCFRLLHYGEANTHFHPEDLPQLEKDALIVMVSSVLNIDMLFSYPVYRYQPEAHFIYLINQIDLLPSSTNLDVLLDRVTQKAKQLNIPYEDIILMSAKNRFDLDNLRTYLSDFTDHHIYLLGVQNSGKTTLYKALTQEQKALAFKKAGLTQEALIAPFGNHVLYDMPGLYQDGYLHQMLPYDVYKKLIPDQEMNPRIFQIKSEQSLILEGLIGLTFKSEALSAVIYGTKQLKIHKTNPSKMKNMLKHPADHFEIFVQTYETKAFKIPRGKMQVTFADMGFMHIVGPTHLEITYPKGMHLTITEAMFE